jgi:hypothetical protein
MNIKPTVFDKYFDAVDWMIDNNHIGQECTIVYPPIKVSNTTNSNVVGMRNTGIGEFGGPTTYSHEYSNTKDTIEQVTTDTINLRLYWSKKDWIKIGGVGFPDADCMIIGYLADLTKLKNASEIVFSKNEGEWRMSLACEPFPHGFTKNRYFMGYLKRNS